METLLKAWRSESAFRPVYSHPPLTKSGVELGAGTVIVSVRGTMPVHLDKA